MVPKQLHLNDVIHTLFPAITPPKTHTILALTITSIITQRHTRRVVFMSSPGSVGEGRSSVFVILGLSCARGATVVCRTVLAHGRSHWPGAGRVFGLRRRVPLVRARHVHPHTTPKKA